LSLLPLRYRRAWIGSVWLLILAIVAASLAPDVGPAAVAGYDKLGHFTAYFALALLGSGVVAVGVVPWVMARALLLGLVLEAAQALLTETRTADWADVLANTAGVLAAWCLVHGGRAGWAVGLEAWLAGLRRH